MERTSNSLDTSDFFIIVFVAIIFVTGAIVLFKFVRNNKKERSAKK